MFDVYCPHMQFVLPLVNLSDSLFVCVVWCGVSVCVFFNVHSINNET